MDAYRSYRRAHCQLKALLEHLRQSDPIGQELVLRGVAVLIFAEFEAFLRGVLQSFADDITTGWDGMLPTQQRHVAVRAVEELRRIVGYADMWPRDLAEAIKLAHRVTRDIRKVAAWLDEPGRFARDTGSPRLELLADPNDVLRLVAKAMVQVREDGTEFLVWLRGSGVDPDSYVTSLGQLLQLRNDVAHQNALHLQPTVDELRDHQRRLAHLVRLVRSYATVDAIPDRVAADDGQETTGDRGRPQDGVLGATVAERVVDSPVATHPRQPPDIPRGM